MRKRRIRKSIVGTKARPRLSVYISNRQIYAQVIDDSKHTTLVQVSTAKQKLDTTSMTQKAVWVGTEIANKSKAAKVKQVVFDRNGRLYHGRLKALAEAARAGGLEF